MKIKHLLVISCLFFSIQQGASRAWADQVKISTGETMVLASDSIIEPSERYKKVLVFSGRVDFRGETDEMVILGGNVTLRQGSRVNKNLVLMGGNLQQDDGAQLSGDIVTVKAPEGIWKAFLIAAPMIGGLFSGTLWFLTTSLYVLLSWASACAVFAIFPAFRERTQTLFREEKIPSFFWALCSGLVFVPGLVLLVITILGIALIPLYLALFGLGYWLGHFVSALWLGQKIVSLTRSSLSWPWALLIGLVVSVLVGAWIAFVGSAALFLLTVIGSGTVLKAWYQSALRKTA